VKIKALKAFTIRDSETGELIPIAHGGIAEVSDTLGSSLISDGLAEAYTLISPTGSVNISSNGTVDVAEYASAVVNVPDFKNLVDRSITSVTADMLQDVTKIGDAAFGGCSSLASVEIPATVNLISGMAFYSCSSLTSLTVLAITPPALIQGALDGTSDDLIIYVPAESVDTYKAAENWSNYASKIQAIPS